MSDKTTYSDSRYSLFIQICALNEEKNIGSLISSIPREIPSVSGIKIVVVDDGSTDNTATVSGASGADIIVRHTNIKGLAWAFQTGLDVCLKNAADIIVNIDANGQYQGQDISALIAPILAGNADVVIGDRQIDQMVHFSATKRFMQKLERWFVQNASGLNIPDALSGFRAYSREAALRLFITSKYSYPVQSLIQAGRSGLIVLSVPVKASESDLRHRTERTSFGFVAQQLAIFLRTCAAYAPIKTFGGLSIPVLLIGAILLVRLVIITAASGTLTGYMQSLVFGVLTTTSGLLLIVTGIIVDRIQENRRLIDETLYRIRSGSDIKTPPTASLPSASVPAEPC